MSRSRCVTCENIRTSVVTDDLQGNESLFENHAQWIERVEYRRQTFCLGKFDCTDIETVSRSSSRALQCLSTQCHVRGWDRVSRTCAAACGVGLGWGGVGWSHLFPAGCRAGPLVVVAGCGEVSAVPLCVGALHAAPTPTCPQAARVMKGRARLFAATLPC